LSSCWKIPLLTASSSTTASTMKSACFMPCAIDTAAAMRPGEDVTEPKAGDGLWMRQVTVGTEAWAVLCGKGTGMVLLLSAWCCSTKSDQSRCMGAAGH
jgi:hypothetical protein